MSDALCPWPGCGTAPTRNAVFCTDHHFAIPARQARWLIRLKCEAARCGDEEKKRHLEHQVAAYARGAIRAALPHQQKEEASVQ